MVCKVTSGPLTMRATTGFYTFTVFALPGRTVVATGTANELIPPVVTPSLPPGCYEVYMFSEAGSFAYHISW